MMSSIKAELETVIETQTLMQLLVAKGVITPNEVKQTRKLVERHSPRVKRLMYEFMELDHMLSAFEKSDDEKRKFFSLLDKMMKDRDSLTEEEIDYLDSKLDFKKYWEEENK